MFEMAKDWARENTNYVVVGAYLSPVGDAYKKTGLAPAKHRVAMCELAVNEEDPKTRFVMVDTWEARQSQYQPTAKVLDHLDYELNEKRGGLDNGKGEKVKIKIALLGGADLVETFTMPGVWSREDLDHIICDYGAVIIERAGTNIDEVMAQLEPKWQKHIYVIHQQIRNDVSSTKIRYFLDQNYSIRYLVPRPVIFYIEENRLYRSHQPSPEPGIPPVVQDGNDLPPPNS